MKTSTTKKNGKAKRGGRGMGYLYKRGGGYWLEYRVEGKRVRQALHGANGKPITKKSDAEKERLRIVAPFLAKDKEEAQRQVFSRMQAAREEVAITAEAAKDDIRIVDAWQAYIALPPVDTRKAEPGKRPDTGEATLVVYSDQWQRFSNWMTTHHPEAPALGDIDEGIANEYITRLDQSGITAKTRNKHVATLARVITVLSKQAKVTSNHFAGQRRKESTNHRNELTEKQIHKLVDGTSGELRLLLALGFYTGLRRVDCCTLRWDEVEMKRNTITRTLAKTERTSGKIASIPIHRDLYPMLETQRAATDSEYVLPAMADLYHNHRDTLTANLQRHFLNCGIDVHRKGTGRQIERTKSGNPRRNKKTGNVITKPTGKRAVSVIGFHSLRHTFVTMNLEAGVPLSVVESMVGHSSPEMTRKYAHISADAARKGIAMLPSVTGDLPRIEHREPLPDWARELLAKQNAKNWKKVRAEILAG